MTRASEPYVLLDGTQVLLHEAFTESILHFRPKETDRPQANWVSQRARMYLADCVTKGGKAVGADELLSWDEYDVCVALKRVYVLTYGDKIEFESKCAHCGAPLPLSFSINDLAEVPPDLAAQKLRLSDGREVSIRRRTWQMTESSVKAVDPFIVRVESIDGAPCAGARDLRPRYAKEVVAAIKRLDGDAGTEVVVKCPSADCNGTTKVDLLTSGEGLSAFFGLEALMI